MDLKPFATYYEQICKLKNRGCVIRDEEKCRNILKNINYYRLSAYFLPFKKDNDTYVEGTTFERVYRIYEFDRKLRKLVFSAIETIEVSLRARLAYFHSEKYGALGYLSPENFNNKHNAEKFCVKIDRELENNKKVLFVKHHMEQYNGQFPLWVLCELFTFGMLSYFYNDLTTADKKAFCGVHYKEMASWLRCCTDIRNICAHYGRLYYRVFPAIPAGLHLEKHQERRLWGAVKTLKVLYPDEVQWKNEFVTPLQALIEEYSDAILLRHLAFPENWQDQLLEKSK